MCVTLHTVKLILGVASRKMLEVADKDVKAQIVTVPKGCCYYRAIGAQATLTASAPATLRESSVAVQRGLCAADAQ
jgi:hypothetical protein